MNLIILLIIDLIYQDIISLLSLISLVIALVDNVIGSFKILIELKVIPEISKSATNLVLSILIDLVVMFLLVLLLVVIPVLEI